MVRVTLLLMLGLVVGGAEQDRGEIQDTAKGKSGEHIMLPQRSLADGSLEVTW